MPSTLLIPLNNVYAKGDYCAEVYVGTPAKLYHLIVDSGSSTFVIHPDKVDPSLDHVAPSQWLQVLRYGVGNWYGPVVKASVKIGHHPHLTILDDVDVALAEYEAQGTFGKADGILGLAYSSLNQAHDVSALAPKDTQHTWPWTEQWQAIAQQPSFTDSVYQQPSVTVSPLLDVIADKHFMPDQFALMLHRSSIYQTDSTLDEQALMQQPLNRGVMVLGAPHDHTDLHHPQYKTVKVLYDKYYNVNVKAIQVAGSQSINVAPMIYSTTCSKRSNTIVDTGASAMVLPQQLFDYVMTSLSNAHPGFNSLLSHYRQFTGKEIGIPLSQLHLGEWPDIIFTLEGENGEDIELVLTPDSYWQVHAPEPNQASFKLTTLPGWGEQLILGLPLLSEYFCIFDRAKNQTGVIKFAEKRLPIHRTSTK